MRKDSDWDVGLVFLVVCFMIYALIHCYFHSREDIMNKNKIDEVFAEMIIDGSQIDRAIELLLTKNEDVNWDNHDLLIKIIEKENK